MNAFGRYWIPIRPGRSIERGSHGQAPIPGRSPAGTRPGNAGVEPVRAKDCRRHHGVREIPTHGRREAHGAAIRSVRNRGDRMDQRRELCGDR